MEIRGIVFASSVLEISLTACGSLTLACSIESARPANSKSTQSRLGTRNGYYFTIKASEFTRNFDLLNSKATLPEDHWGIVSRWSGISVILSKYVGIWLLGWWITMQLPFMTTLKYTRYPSIARGSSLAVNDRTLGVRVTPDRPRTP